MNQIDRTELERLIRETEALADMSEMPGVILDVPAQQPVPQECRELLEKIDKGLVCGFNKAMGPRGRSDFMKKVGEKYL